MDAIEKEDLKATARRIASGQWTVGPEGAIEVQTNPALAELVRLGYAVLFYTPAYRRADDHWVLTPTGVQWLES